ncbi:MAG: hypothetical protein E6J61_05775 [Deltaproteobacteria bacterium]|nr:MAG: hypothetical protein E6J61_05775 [Deltaproteobacteria bacterium]
MAIATDPSGTTIALFSDPSAPLPGGLRKLDAKGKEVWTRFFDGSTNTTIDPASSLATDGSGDIYLMWASNCADFGCRGTIDFGDGATPAAAVVKLDPDGKFLWEKRLNEDGSTLAVNAKGDAVFRSWSSTDPSTTSVVRVGADGSPVWTLSSRGLAEVGIDPDGNVVVGAFTSQTDPIFGQTFASNGPVVAKLASADGNVLWAKRIAAGTIGNIQGVGVDASGAIVAAGHVRSRGGAAQFEQSPGDGGERGARGPLDRRVGGSQYGAGRQLHRHRRLRERSHDFARPAGLRSKPRQVREGRRRASPCRASHARRRSVREPLEP